MSYDITAEEVLNLISGDQSLIDETCDKISVRFKTAGFFELHSKEKDRIINSIGKTVNKSFLKGMTIPERMEYIEKELNPILKDMNATKYKMENLFSLFTEQEWFDPRRWSYTEESVEKMRNYMMQSIDHNLNKDNSITLSFGEFYEFTEEKLTFSIIELNYSGFIGNIELSLDELDYSQALLSSKPGITIGELIHLGIQTQYFVELEEKAENPMDLKADYHLLYNEIKDQINHIFNLLKMEKKNMIEMIKFYQSE